MTWRKDKFVIGQRVIWANDEMATITNGRDRFGDGPFVLSEVIDRSYNKYDDFGSNWQSMGHTQHVKIENDFESLFSGSFFKLLEE